MRREARERQTEKAGGSVALTLFRQDKLREPAVKIQSTFPLCLNGIEAKGTHIPSFLEILLVFFFFFFTKKIYGVTLKS